MAFVPGYEHDVFITYAHIDDEPAIPGDNGTRWVSTVRQILQIRLDQRLGRRDAVKMWIDHGEVRGNQPVASYIRQVVSRSATLVAIFSRGYLSSAWCLQERELFIATAGGAEVAAARLFLVQLEEIPRAEWPQAFAYDVGYPFYQKDPVAGLVSRLGDPKPDPYERAYWTMLNKLSTDIAYTLEQLAARAPTLPQFLNDKELMMTSRKND